ncbi:MAG: DUF2318 domain-containing protein [Methanobacteriota archaeon]
MAKHNNSKQKKFTETEEKKGVKPAYIAGIIVLAIVGGLLFGGSGPEKAEKIGVSAQDIGASGGSDEKNPDSLYIPISAINDGIAHFYEFPSQMGKTIRFFVLKSSDGVFRAAFDACDVCYREKKGYRQEGDNMICNNCGRKFPSNLINVEQGGCNPAPLTREIVDDNLVIKKSDIELGARYF